MANLSKCIGKPTNCEHALHYLMLSYPHEFIYIPGKYSRYLRYGFRVWDYVFVDLVWWNIYCNGGKVMFIKKKKKLSVYFFNLRCGLFPFTWRVCCWMVTCVCRWIQQWRTDVHNIHGTEQLTVLALLIYCGEELLSWMLFLKKKKKRLFTGLYINKTDCAPHLLYFHFSCHVWGFLCFICSCICRWDYTGYSFLLI